MTYSIGKQIGIIVAQLENDLHDDPDDINAMNKLAVISKSFHNFAIGDLKGFHADYEQGYDEVASYNQNTVERKEPMEAQHGAAFSAAHDKADGP